MNGLTHAQRELLAFIESYMADSGGVSPSFEEMKEGVGLKSKSGVHRLITALVERGAILRLPNRSRSLEVVKPQPMDGLAAYSSHELVAELARRGALSREHRMVA